MELSRQKNLGKVLLELTRVSMTACTSLVHLVSELDVNRSCLQCWDRLAAN